MSIIEFKDVSKIYTVKNHKPGLAGAIKDLFFSEKKDIHAVKNVDFTVSEGELLALIGPNGAGKSSVIKLIVGLLEATKGNIKILGANPLNNKKTVLKNLGIVFGQRSQLWWDIPVIDSFKMNQYIYGVSDKKFKRNMDFFSDAFSLSDLIVKPVRQLSLGQRILCEVACSLLHDPKIVLLDEPTIGLDVEVKDNLRKIIKDYNSEFNTTFLITSHDVDDIERLCNRSIVIDKGEVVFDGDTKNFVNHFSGDSSLEVYLSEDTSSGDVDIEKSIRESFNSIQSVVRRSNTMIEISYVGSETDILPLLNLVNSMVKVVNFNIKESSLESALINLYRGVK